MKKLLTLLLAITMVVSLSACGNERKGVPDSVIYEQLGDRYEKYDQYQINTSHNVNRETHIDSVAVSIETKGEYGTATEERVLQYRYHRDSDLWEFIEESEIIATKLEPNEEKLVGDWLGDDGVFCLAIHDISGSTATVSYGYTRHMGLRDEWKQIDYVTVEMSDFSHYAGRAALLLGSSLMAEVYSDLYIDVFGVHSILPYVVEKVG